MKKSLLLSVVLFCSLSFAFGQTQLPAKTSGKKAAQTLTPEQKKAAIDAANLQRKEAERKAASMPAKVGNDTRFSKATTANAVTPSKQK